ncbi:hypothetical protein [Mesorhizobium amorphae]|uniref:hypothetical protein n=1 Tax=Mesorhizobium amorphae TaxID=71433 RepID=UPI0024E18177|nr:hypothetical protein [Mesorhizobium amorphae]
MQGRLPRPGWHHTCPEPFAARQRLAKVGHCHSDLFVGTAIEIDIFIQRLVVMKPTSNAWPVVFTQVVTETAEGASIGRGAFWIDPAPRRCRFVLLDEGYVFGIRRVTCARLVCPESFESRNDGCGTITTAGFELLGIVVKRLVGKPGSNALLVVLKEPTAEGQKTIAMARDGALLVTPGKECRPETLDEGRIVGIKRAPIAPYANCS